MSPDSPQRTLLILGASGDLTARLLLPGLGGLLAIDEVNDLSLVGSATDDWDDDRWRAQVADSFAAASASGIEVDAVAQRSRYLRADVTSEDDLRPLLDACDGTAPRASTTYWRSSCRRTMSTGSTISWECRPCSTSWGCASPTA